MWRISLLDPKTNKPYVQDWDLDNSLIAQKTVLDVPILFCEGYNFKGMLNERTVDLTLLSLEQFLDRWKHCKPYMADYFAPTMGNISKAVQQLVSFAQNRPEGIWLVET